MAKSNVRVRFAPSPTGMMHLGNVRTALLNYLFATKKNGTFIIRVEDTDPERNFDVGAQQILKDLSWLDLTYDEGPIVGGPYQPYYQSERNEHYKNGLERLLSTGRAYRCFCTTQELEKKRERQIALKMPPRYDRTCLSLSPETVEKNLANHVPYLWRFKLDHTKSVIVHDMAKGDVSFDLANFSDFPVTRADGSYTFLFSNAIDDADMKITHILRGEDHLANTANQVALFEALSIPAPLYWHLPILCSLEGSKLSKRDFGFSLKDLKEAGYLPEAIINYLAIIGGSFQHEVMNREELLNALNFDTISQSGNIKFDAAKLAWMNHKWIERYDISKLVDEAMPFFDAAFPEANNLDKSKKALIITTLRSELTTLADIKKAAAFYFHAPKMTQTLIEHELTQELGDQNYAPTLIELTQNNANKISQPDQFIAALKTECAQRKIPVKALYLFLRLVLTGSKHGASLVDTINLLGSQEVTSRLQSIAH